MQPILILAVPQIDLLKKSAELWAVLSITSGCNSCTQNECNQEVADIRQIQYIKKQYFDGFNQIKTIKKK